jgi:hypothetical protein
VRRGGGVVCLVSPLTPRPPTARSPVLEESPHHLLWKLGGAQAIVGKLRWGVGGLEGGWLGGWVSSFGLACTSDIRQALAQAIHSRAGSLVARARSPGWCRWPAGSATSQAGSRWWARWVVVVVAAWGRGCVEGEEEDNSMAEDSSRLALAADNQPSTLPNSQHLPAPTQLTSGAAPWVWAPPPDPPAVCTPCSASRQSCGSRRGGRR